MNQPTDRVFIVGGAGFIGGHFVDQFLSLPSTQKVTIFDNFSSGREWHFARHLEDNRFSVIRGDVKELDLLTHSMRGHDTIIHLASNPDIAKAAIDPTVDFYEGTLLTHNVIEAVRRSGAKSILYASGSGVYGDLGSHEAREDYGPLIPVSTYGASKLAGEALLSSYAYMFGIQACVFRFGNVVGPRQTHGVGFDFAKRLLQDPSKLRILGDGSQSKSYVHVEDILQAVLMAHQKVRDPFQTFNVATGDYIAVKEIAELAVECVGLKAGSVKFEYTGGNRGWKGDVPIVRLNTDRIRSVGWECRRNSRAALKDAIESMLPDVKAGKI